MNNFSRATSAFVLTASLLFSSVAAVAQTPATKPDDAQKTTQTPSEQKAPADQTQAAQKEDPKKATPAPVPVVPVKTSNKPLSTDENPDMIGKRNINHGIIAKMSGSTEKEVRQGDRKSVV